VGVPRRVFRIGRANRAARVLPYNVNNIRVGVVPVRVIIVVAIIERDILNNNCTIFSLFENTVEREYHGHTA